MKHVTEGVLVRMMLSYIAQAAITKLVVVCVLRLVVAAGIVRIGCSRRPIRHHTSMDEVDTCHGGARRHRSTGQHLHVPIAANTMARPGPGRRTPAVTVVTRADPRFRALCGYLGRRPSPAHARACPEGRCFPDSSCSASIGTTRRRGREPRRLLVPARPTSHPS